MPQSALESAPLLAQKPEDDVFNRFSPSQKRIIFSVAAWTGILPFFVSGSFIPSIPQVVKDLHSSASVINLAVSLSILVVSLSGLFWATYSSFYGRRPIYLWSLVFLCLGSLGVGLSQNVFTLLLFRVIQSFGASAGLSVGSGVVADIYRFEDRGTAMGVFFASSLVGTALAPLAGGLASHYYTWRHMQYALLISGPIAVILVFFFLPETSHPGSRGIEKYDAASRSSRWVFLNPLSGLGLLKSPNLMAVTLVGTVSLLTDYVLLIPIAYTIGEKYGIHNEATIGALFLPVGFGNFVGAPIAGRLSDRSVVYWRSRRNGEWMPEDRLRVTMIGAAILVPLSVLCSGLCTRFVSGKLGITLNVIFLFFNGIGVDFVLSPSAAYNIDVMHSRSAEIMAANNGFRGILLALITTSILPSVNSIGVLPTNTISAALAWIGALLMWITIKFGDRMRASVDVGFSTSNN